MLDVAVLFVERDSTYKSLAGCDCYDVDRDARTFPGGLPVIAHPPCRLWGTPRFLSTAPIEEKALALWAVGAVRRSGGVLEHPRHSRLWQEAGLPKPNTGERDSFGGFSIGLPQFWFGHRAEKLTWLYFVGLEPRDVPPIPLTLGEATHVVTQTRCGRPELKKKERRETPVAFARWLVAAARRVRTPARQLEAVGG